jgi:CobQ-like glutamine amidotransferase family enzyme
MSGIVVLHLYPRELGINGDVGNVMALAKRAEWRGMPLTVVDHEIGADLPETVHLVHIGSGPVSAQELVHDDLVRIAPTLRRWAEDGVPFLAIAGGWQLLGTSLTLADGRRLEGAGVFPSDAVLSGARIVDEVWTTDAAGFENHGAVTTVHGGTPFAAGRGLRVGDSVATTLHGPFLPMNPSWADDLLTVAAARAGIPMGADDDRVARADEYAERSRDAIRQRLRL